MQKRLWLVAFIVLSLFIAACAAGTSTARNAPSYCGTDNDVFKCVVTLQFLGPEGLNVIQQPIDPIDGVMRFLILFLLTIVGGRVLGGFLGQGIGIAIGFIVGLMSVIFLPAELIVAAAAGQSTMIGLILLLIPVGLLLSAYFFIGNKVVRMLLLIVLIIVMFMVHGVIRDVGSNTSDVWSGVLGSAGTLWGWLEGLAIVLALLSILSLVGSDKFGGSGGFSKGLHFLARVAEIRNPLEKTERETEREEGVKPGRESKAQDLAKAEQAFELKLIQETQKLASEGRAELSQYQDKLKNKTITDTEYQELYDAALRWGIELTSALADETDLLREVRQLYRQLDRPGKNRISDHFALAQIVGKDFFELRKILENMRRDMETDSPSYDQILKHLTLFVSGLETVETNFQVLLDEARKLENTS